MKGNLLIVDDEPMLTDSLKFLCRHVCENIFIAENGAEAIAIISQNNIHCVLSDFQMPVMGGIELFRTVRATNDSMPFIFYTGHGSETIEKELASFKNFEVIAKPSFDKLSELVQNLIARTY